MLYIIGGIILFLIFARFGSDGIGCFFFLVLTFLLWRIGILPFIFRIIARIFQWIAVRVVYYYHKFFGEEEVVSYLSTKISGLLFLS
jgi:hypothetical protein